MFVWSAVSSQDFDFRLLPFTGIASGYQLSDKTSTPTATGRHDGIPR